MTNQSIDSHGLRLKVMKRDRERKRVVFATLVSRVDAIGWRGNGFIAGLSKLVAHQPAPPLFKVVLLSDILG